MNLSRKIITSVLLVTTISSIANAAFTIDVTGNGAYDGQNPLEIPFSDSGYSATASFVPTGGALNSNSGQFGIGDAEIDGISETITITFSENIEFNFIDLGGVGADLADGASLTVAGSQIDLYTGVTDFNGSLDVYTPSTAISVSKGTAIALTGSTSTSSFFMQTINVTVVPEPGTYALLAGCFALGFVMLRHRTQ